jgi:hypothetical protein
LRQNQQRRRITDFKVAVPAMNQHIRFCKATDGVQLAYAVTGEGSPLVMSSSWLTHLEHQWRCLAWRPWLDAFASEHKTLRHDSRGCGLSDRTTKNLSFETWVRDLLFDKLCVKQRCQAIVLAREAGLGKASKLIDQH